MKVVVNGPRREVCVESGVIILVDVYGAEPDIVNVLLYTVVGPGSDLDAEVVLVCVVLDAEANFSSLLLPL
jgi:hypothetical protein